MIISQKKYKIGKKIHQLEGGEPKTTQQISPTKKKTPLSSKEEVINVLTLDICNILRKIFNNKKLFNFVKKSLIKLYNIPYPFSSIEWKNIQKKLKNENELKKKIKKVLEKLDNPNYDNKDIIDSLIDLMSYIFDVTFTGFLVKKSLSLSGVLDDFYLPLPDEINLLNFYNEVYINQDKIFDEILKQFLEFFIKNPDGNFKDFFIKLCKTYSKNPIIGILFENLILSIPEFPMNDDSSVSISEFPMNDDSDVSNPNYDDDTKYDDKLLKETFKEFMEEFEKFYEEKSDDTFKNFFIKLCKEYSEKPDIGNFFKNLALSFHNKSSFKNPENYSKLTRNYVDNYSKLSLDKNIWMPMVQGLISKDPLPDVPLLNELSPNDPKQNRNEIKKNLSDLKKISSDIDKKIVEEVEKKRQERLSSSSESTTQSSAKWDKLSPSKQATVIKKQIEKKEVKEKKKEERSAMSPEDIKSSSEQKVKEKQTKKDEKTLQILQATEANKIIKEKKKQDSDTEWDNLSTEAREKKKIEGKDNKKKLREEQKKAKEEIINKQKQEISSLSEKERKEKSTEAREKIRKEQEIRKEQQLKKQITSTTSDSDKSQQSKSSKTTTSKTTTPKTTTPKTTTPKTTTTSQAPKTTTPKTTTTSQAPKTQSPLPPSQNSMTREEILANRVKRKEDAAKIKKEAAERQNSSSTSKRKKYKILNKYDN